MQVFECKVGDLVRVRHGWNPMGPARLVTRIDPTTGEIELDCTERNGVRITLKNKHIWELVNAARG